MEVIEDHTGQHHFGGQLMVVMETCKKNNWERTKESRVMVLCRCTQQATSKTENPFPTWERD